MPAVTDIQPPVPGSGYDPDLDPDIDPEFDIEHDSSSDSAHPEPTQQRAQGTANPQGLHADQWKRKKQEPRFNPSTDSPIVGGGATGATKAWERDSQGRSQGNKPGSGGATDQWAGRGQNAQHPRSGQSQKPGSHAGRGANSQGVTSGSAQAGGGATRAWNPQASGGATQQWAGGGAGNTPGPKGAGGGKGAFAQAAAQGAQRGLEQLKHGNVKEAAIEGSIGAAEAGGDFLLSKAFFLLASPVALLWTLTMSVVIGWNILLIAPKFLKALVKGVTGREVNIHVEGWQKAVIIAMDAIILFLILIVVTVSMASFCYALTSTSYKERIIAFIVNPGAAGVAEIGRKSLPDGLTSFCGKLTGNATAPGSKNSYGGGVSGNGDTTDPNWVPTADSCGFNPEQLCKPEFPNDRCTPDVVARCNSDEYEDLFARGLDLYYATNGKGIEGMNMLVLVKSIASVERKCQRTGACSDASACGMMQFIPSSAVRYARQCGTEVGTPFSEWANNNPIIQVCMAAHHLEDNADRVINASQTPQVRDVAACYNAGEGRCITSKKCLGSRSCDNSPTLDWECGCAPPGVQRETWPYARKVSGCYYNAYAQ